MSTVKVKVFVNVNSYGEWAAGGGETLEADTKASCLFDMIGKLDTQQGYWIEAELPIPPKKDASQKESFNVTVTKD